VCANGCSGTILTAAFGSIYRDAWTTSPTDYLSVLKERLDEDELDALALVFDKLVEEVYEHFFTLLIEEHANNMRCNSLYVVNARTLNPSLILLAEELL
jgi:hypothetical protein